jgi:hypothetical protein
MKLQLYGDEDHEPTKAGVVALAEEVVKTSLLQLLPAHLAQLDFETRKDAAQVRGRSPGRAGPIFPPATLAAGGPPPRSCLSPP